MFNLKIIQIFFFSALIVISKNNEADTNDENFLSLDCIAVPSFEDKICYAKTGSSLGPYKDVVFYRRTPLGELYLLGSDNDGGASFGSIGFSTGGRYMWLEWVEEGHPSFSFYKTQSFLADGLNAHEIDFLDAYGFGRFIGFSDDGIVSYSKDQNSIEECEQGPPCIYTLNLNKQSQSKDKNEDVYLCRPDESIGFYYMKDKWVTAVNDITDNEFIIKKLNNSNNDYQDNTYGLFEVGDKLSFRLCTKDINIICRNDLKKLILSTDTGRFIESNMSGYWEDEENNDTNPSMTIGKCSKFRITGDESRYIYFIQ